MQYFKRFVYFVGISGPLLFLDQWSKHWAEATLKHYPPIYYWNGFFQFRYAENSGAWGSLGATWPEPVRQTFLVIFPSLLLLFFLGHLLLSKNINLAKNVAYSCILAGGIGNLVDRIRYGFVVDFMYMGTDSIHTNIFNVADMSIMTGLGLAIIISYREGKTQSADKNEVSG